MTISQNRSRKLIRQLADIAGTVNKLALATKIPNSTLYNFLNEIKDNISERDGDKLLKYAKKHKSKMTMRDLRPHMPKD